MPKVPFCLAWFLLGACADPPETGAITDSISIPQWYAKYDLSPAGLDTEVATDRGLGAVPISISAFGTPSNPEFATVFGVRNGPAYRVEHGVGTAAWQAAYATDVHDGYGATLLSFDGDVNNPVWAAVFTSGASTAVGASLLSGDRTNSANLEFWLDFAHANQYIPTSLSIYGSATAPAYALIMVPNPTGTRWAVGDTGSWDDPPEIDSYADNMTGSVMQQYWNFEVPAWNRVAMWDRNSANRLVTVYTEDSLGGEVGVGTVDKAGLITAVTTQEGNDYYPISIQGGGAGSSALYSALFAQADRPFARTFQAIGSGSSQDPAIPSIDTAINNFMAGHDVRQAALAVIDGNKLVYARGYSLQESTLPATQPTSPFRLASVSKTVIAMEIMYLIDHNLGLALGDTAESHLHLTRYDGLPVDPKFNNITIKHLLQHNFPGLGAGNCLLRDMDVSETAAIALGGVALPLTRTQAISVAMASPYLVADTQGDSCYSNFGYVLLGQIIEAVRNKPLLDAIQADLFTPMHITHDFVASWDPAHQAVNEPVYRSDLIATPNVNLPYAQLLPQLGMTAYGGGNAIANEAADGLSIAATDIARLLTVLNTTPGYPLYSKPNTASTLLDGLYGLDQSAKDLMGNWRYVKGGLDAGVQTTVSIDPGGISYVLLWAADGLDVASGPDNWWPTWNTLESALYGANLGARTDLFPQYGMPAE